MGIFASRVDYKFLSQCEKQLSQVDNSLSSLASSVDSVHGTVKLLLRQLEENTDTEENISQNNVTALTLTRDLLESVEHSLYHEKMALLQGISQIIQLMISKTENKTLIMRSMPTLERLSIDKYITDFQKKQKLPSNTTARQKTALSNGKTGSSVDPERSPENMERKIKELEKDMETIKLANAMLRTENDEKRTELEDTKKELEVHTSKINALMEEKEQLTKDLEKARRQVETIPVQIYHQRRGDMMSLVEQELLHKIADHLEPDDKEIEVIKCATSSDIQPNKPLLILCMSTSRLGTDAANAIQGVLKMENTALLIFHHKNEHALPSQTSDRVLAGPEFKALRGIYDLAFLTGKGMYVCEMNTRAVTGINDFICKVSEETFSTRSKIHDTTYTMLSS